MEQASSKRAEVIIIGGGVMGCSIAHYLTRSRVKPLLLEAGALASGSSGACDGMVYIQSKKPGIHLELALAGRKLFPFLAAELEMDIEFKASGGLVVLESEDQRPALEQYAAQRIERGLDIQMIDQAGLHDLEPNLAPELPGAAFCPLDGLVNPINLTHGLARSASAAGARILTNRRVAGLERSGHDWLVRADGREFSAPVVVNAAGSWAPEIGRLSGLEIPIKPRRGQLLVTRRAQPLLSRPITTAAYVAAKYNPELAARAGMGVSLEQTQAGSLLLGSTREFVGYDRRTTLDGLAGVARRAAAVLPCLKELSIIRAFAGLRPYTPDSLPILGEVQGQPGLIIAAGHEGDGITLAPITGKLIAQLITSGRTTIDLSPLSLSRFDGSRGAGR